jgi:hypothetical protein
MCTYVTAQTEAAGSAKGRDGWFPLTRVTAYFDHPVHAQAEHTMNIDFANAERGPGSRVAVELTAETAVALLRTVAQVLTDVPGDLTGIDPEQARRLLAAAQGITVGDSDLAGTAPEGVAAGQPR